MTATDTIPADAQRGGLRASPRAGLLGPLGLAGLLGLLGLAGGIGCSDTLGHRGHRARVTVEHPVARVDGEVITAEEVKEIAEGSGLDARAALDRAIEVHVLAREATRRGLTTREERDDVAWHARVQLFLQREIVENVTDANLAQGDVDEALSTRRVELSPGELLRMVHFVAKVQAGEGAVAHRAARARAEAFRARLLALGGGHPTVEQFAQVAREMAGPLVRGEALEPFDRDGYTAHGRYVPVFATQAFALTEDAPVSQVFETNYGEHVALRLGSIPPAPRPAAEVLAIVRQDLLVTRRAEVLQALVQRLRLRVGARVSEATLATADPRHAGSVPAPGVRAVPP